MRKIHNLHPHCSRCREPMQKGKAIVVKRNVKIWRCPKCKDELVHMDDIMKVLSLIKARR